MFSLDTDLSMIVLRMIAMSLISLLCHKYSRCENQTKNVQYSVNLETLALQIRAAALHVVSRVYLIIYHPCLQCGYQAENQYEYGATVSV
jgi:hypothetical protein